MAETAGVGLEDKHVVTQPKEAPPYFRPSPEPEDEEGAETRSPSLLVPLGAHGAECSRRAPTAESSVLGAEAGTILPAMAPAARRPRVKESLNTWSTHVLSPTVVNAHLNDPMTMTPLEPLDE